MIGTIDVKVQAHNPNFPLEPVFTFINSAQSFRIRNVPRAIGKWNITKVFIHLNYPDETTISKECVLNGNIWIGTVEGCATSGTSTNGFYVTASGIDENENVITNYVLGAGDLYVKDLDGTIDPERVGTKMYFNDTLPTNPKKGDATFIDGVLNVYDGTNWTPVADDPDLSNYYTKTEVDEAIGEVEESIPTKTSDLTNDSGFITSSAIPSNVSSFNNDAGYITASAIPSNVSAFNNDVGYITLAQVPTPSYIEDANGLKIEADLDCTVKDLTLPWTLVDGQDTYTLNYAEQSGKWLYEETETKKIELTYSAENSLWELAFYVWNNGEWQYDTGSTTTQEEDATSLSILEWTLTRSILKNGRLALQGEIPTPLQPYPDDQFATKVCYYYDDNGTTRHATMSCDWSGAVDRTLVENTVGSISSIYSIVFGTGVTEIADNTFMKSQSLMEIYFKKTLRRIGANAFKQCPRLTKVVFEPHENLYEYISERVDNVVNYDDCWLEIGDMAFANCINLAMVKLPQFSSIRFGTDTFLSTFTQQAFGDICPFKGMFFYNVPSQNYFPTAEQLTTIFPSNVANSVRPWNTVSKEWVEDQHYGKNFVYKTTSFDYISTARRASWNMQDKAFYNITSISIPSAARQKVVWIAYMSDTHAPREIYADLNLPSDIPTITNNNKFPANTSSIPTYAEVDWYLNGTIEEFKADFLKADTHFTWHFLEYQPNHFLVEKIQTAPSALSQFTNDVGFITSTALTPYREKSDLYYEHSFSKTNWQNVPRFIMDYDGTQTIFDKFDSTLNRWNVSTGTSDWYVQESLVGMEADPQFTLTKLESGIANILPTEGAGTTTVSFIDMGIEGTFTMDMSDQLVCRVYVDRQISALEARIAALENNNQ